MHADCKTVDSQREHVRREKHGDDCRMHRQAREPRAILQKDRQKDPSAGYARDGVPMLAELWPLAAKHGVKFVLNAGGLNPQGAREATPHAFDGGAIEVAEEPLGDDGEAARRIEVRLRDK
jgi:hypothetical protein